MDAASLSDRLDRPLRDLRISVTDRCNFRCSYCMPRELFGADFRFLPRSEILTYEEIHRVAVVFHRLGVRKFRVTGGEPLLRRDLPELLRLLSGLTEIDLALTTNGSLLAERAAELARAGLRRVTVSLDSLDEEVFARMNDAGYGVEQVLEGIDAAAAAGLSPIKINAVIRRGVNDHTALDLVRHFKGSGHVVRFIEYMDVGTSNGWRLDDVVGRGELLKRLRAELPLEPLDPGYRGEVARRWRHRDGGGEIGIISSVTRPFCGDCTRLRLSAEGKLYTCLFAVAGHDLRGPLRRGASDEEVSGLIREIWSRRQDRYSEKRSAATADLERIEMSYIGG